MTRWAQAAGLPCSAAIVPLAPEELAGATSVAASGCQTCLPWGKVPRWGLRGAEASMKLWHPKSPRGLRWWGEQHPRPCGQAGPEVGRPPSPGLLVTAGWVGKPRRWERVEEGVRWWERAAPGRGGLEGRRALPGVPWGRQDTALRSPYLFAPYWLALPLKESFIWLHPSSPPPPLHVAPEPHGAPRATLSASGRCSHLPQLGWALHSSLAFLSDLTPTTAF